MSAESAASFIVSGSTVGMSGFTGSGYPKAVPTALAARIEAKHAAGEPFRVRVWTGASTGPELDGALAKVDGIEFRLPYQFGSDRPRARSIAARWNISTCIFSQVAPMAWQGFLGQLDTAVIEVAGILPDGRADPLLLGRQQQDLARSGRQGDPGGQQLAERRAGGHARHLLRHAPCRRTASRFRSSRPDDRIGEPYSALRSRKDRRHRRDRRARPQLAVRRAGRDSRAIAGHLLEFLGHEVKKGRLPAKSAAAAVGRRQRRQCGAWTGLQRRAVRELTAYTEVLQDGMLNLIDVGQDGASPRRRPFAAARGGGSVQRRHGALPRARSSCGRRRSATIRS